MAAASWKQRLMRSTLSGPPAQQDLVFERDENFSAGLAAGVLSAIMGAALWAAISLFSGYQIGWIALLLGFFVAAAVRNFGRGTQRRFAIAGAILVLLSCALGNLLAALGFTARQEALPPAET